MSKRYTLTIPEPWLTRFRETAREQGMSLEQWLREAAELAWLRGSTR